jgi:hypothetical protein
MSTQTYALVPINVGDSVRRILNSGKLSAATYTVQARSGVWAVLVSTSGRESLEHAAELQLA